MTTSSKQIISHRDGKVKVQDSFSKLFDSLLEMEISDGAFRTFLHILRRDFEDKNGFRKGYVYASTKELAKERNISVRAVEKHLQELSEAGIITKRKRSYRIHIRYEAVITKKCSLSQGHNEQIFATYTYIKEEEVLNKNKKIQALIDSLKMKRPFLAACLADAELEEDGNLLIKVENEFAATELRKNFAVIDQLSKELFGKHIVINNAGS